MKPHLFFKEPLSADAIPGVPATLAPYEPVVVGAVARLCQDPELPFVGFPELCARCKRETLLNLKGATAGPGASVHLEGWRIWPCDSPLRWLSERAISIEAIGIDQAGCDLDPQGGIADLKKRILRGSKDAKEAQNPMLGLNAAAYMSELDAEPDTELKKRCSFEPHRIEYAHRALCREQLTRLLLGNAVKPALEALQQMGLLKFLLPEVEAFVDFHKSFRVHHKDIFEHSLQVTDRVSPTAVLRWAALCHDIGKIHTRGLDAQGKVHFLHHEILGAYLFDGIAARLQFDPEEASRISELIAQHSRANLYSPEWNDNAVRRLWNELEPIFDDLLDLSRADCTSQRPGRRSAVAQNLKALEERIDALRKKDAAPKLQLPRGLGLQLMSHFGLEGGPKVGQLRQLCQKALEQGELQNHPSPEDCIRYLQQLPKDALNAALA